jgi:nitrate reductase (NAD(P)H)
MLWDVLKLAKPKLNGKFVCMQGRDMLPNGYYGTCVKMAQVKDKSRKIIIAHKMNGEDLDPDHGHPLRVIVPGVVAARSVKWLTTLTVTDMPSDNFYHIFDNRVLPTMASPQMVKENQNWWKDERYAIYDLNVQSVITFPSHAEEIVINSDHFPISGYAYSGGGRRIGRVEVSLNRGRTWILCEIEYPEDSYREQNGKVLYGGVIDVDEDKCYTWCFWKVDVASTLLKNSQDIVVRAMDDGMNIQPRGIMS